METTEKIWFNGKILNVSYELNDNGFRIKIFGTNRYGVDYYPAKIFSELDLKAKKALLENFIYAWTRPLALLMDYGLFFESNKPLIKNFVDYGILGDLSRIADLNKVKTQKLLADFKKFDKNGEIIFRGKKSERMLPPKKTSSEKAILALSFGKDSLLSYGIAKEIGLDCQVVFVRDIKGYNKEYIEAEAKHKSRIIKSFIENERIPINFLIDNVDEIFSDRKIKSKIKDLENTNGMLTFVLEFIPVAYYHQAKYLILGNEANFVDSFKNQDGFKTYPSFDQTVIYTKRENQYLKRLTNGNIQVISLIEPIYNLAEMKILYHRYPYLLQYLMSCSPEKKGSEKWCYQCPMCAKAFLYSVAVGGDPQKIGFKQNFFAKRYKQLYPLFTKKITRPHEKPKAVSEEQLLSFLLAYRQGWRGDLINLFKEKYLAVATRREKELRKKFFGIHSSLTIPKEIKNKVIDIYQEELVSLI
ncbi:hypothetical protein A3G50_00650 [Candidatus Jorgensenbacteria bacterium RIFCSPLOWO2_12_FULL_42_11]|uniref:UDP-N-acetyl-alpha-D-muramoyl-L-alanyl-L-glutamate epimerase n=1 Tax=Candidatus Jorgensenbacteria bacterium RIFCSPLOWO2_12_FULL_42_11 TaxID=1798473 RepID=A0A1F6C113_9BACT|nr:MAG: hypothetical protein A3G50_00650 [Candidatus Jorgensenbacteria bacterium RIFCSPLOWO2_12_FULL_42_11]